MTCLSALTSSVITDLSVCMPSSELWLCSCPWLPDQVRACAQGRGTVVTGRIESGIVKVGDEVDIVGIMSPQKTIVTGARAGAAPCCACAMR